MAQVFISHTNYDRPVAHRLAAFLERQGRTVYWRENPHSAAGSESMSELAGADVVIVIWSKSSAAAPFVLQEAIAARDAHKVMHVVNADDRGNVIPVRRKSELIFDVSDLLQISLAVFGFIATASRT